jgi:hypothetical protein
VRGVDVVDNEEARRWLEQLVGLAITGERSRPAESLRATLLDWLDGIREAQGERAIARVRNSERPSLFQACGSTRGAADPLGCLAMCASPSDDAALPALSFVVGVCDTPLPTTLAPPSIVSVAYVGLRCGRRHALPLLALPPRSAFKCPNIYIDRPAR